MSKVRYDEIYFYNEIDNFIKEIDFVYDIYNNKIKTIFISPDYEAQKYKEYLERNPSELRSNNVDDAIMEIECKCFQRYYQVKNMMYRNLINYINLTYQMFDQFLIAFVKQKYDFIITDEKLLQQSEEEKFNYKKFFLEFNFDITKLKGYNKIVEMRELQNVFKHGFGRAMKKLRELRPDYFEQKEKLTPLNMVNNTIIDDTLNISNNDYKEYIKTIKLYLNQFPNKLIHKYEVSD